MPQRFEYVRMTAKDMRERLDEIEMTPGSFARITGVQLARVNQWASGKQDIPPWVDVLLEYMGKFGASFGREVAAEIIERDNLRPELGEFPYQSQRGQ